MMYDIYPRHKYLRRSSVGAHFAEAISMDLGLLLLRCDTYNDKISQLLVHSQEIHLLYTYTGLDP